MRRFFLSTLFPFLFLAPGGALPQGAREIARFRLEVAPSVALAAWLWEAGPAGHE